MLARFKDSISRQHLFSPRDEVLLAVSGGRDSAALAHLMHEAGFRFAIAHCNFHLRPGDCDRDETFVRRLAALYGAPCHVAQFDTRTVAAASGESIEEAARRLRYTFFASLVAQQPSLACVATAHHRDDSVETFFLNLFRGTGIAGLHGIRPVAELEIGNGRLRVVRPLLPFSRAEIDAYIEAHGLEYVEDCTNAQLDARRNRIRLQLMPLLRELYPSVDATMQANMERLADVGEVYRRYVDDLRARVIHKYESRLPSLPVEISAVALSDIEALDPQRTLLFELLRPYGFNASVVDDITKTIKQSGNQALSGRLFYSPSHVAEIHRGLLLVAPQFQIPIPDAQLSTRPWRPGDRFRPKGMKGTRLVSDFLKDLHLSRIERQYVMVQTAPDGTIRSVVGLRDAE
jgi:tRNA(Ile)-lysidine synthase